MSPWQKDAELGDCLHRPWYWQTSSAVSLQVTAWDGARQYGRPFLCTSCQLLLTNRAFGANVYLHYVFDLWVQQWR